MSSISVTCPEAIRTENRRKKLARTWASPEWKAFKKAFIAKHPVCEVCGGKATVPHHENENDYRDSQAYMMLNEATCVALCNGCHMAKHNPAVEVCPVCKVHWKAIWKDKCKHCMTPEERAETEKRVNQRRNSQKAAWIRYREKMKQAQKDWKMQNQDFTPATDWKPRKNDRTDFHSSKGRKVAIIAGRRYGFIVKCPKCGAEKGFGTDRPVTEAKTQCHNCGRHFKIFGRVVEDLTVKRVAEKTDGAMLSGVKP